jgi:CheY-like chemotaxis protein
MTELMKKRIMIVEDDIGVRESFLEILEIENYAVEGHENGLEALKRLTDSSAPRPDLIILDLNMPKMNGLEFLKHSEEVGKNIPVVLLTASRSVIEVLELNREIRIARKPIELEIFVAIVKELLKN